MKQMLLIFAVFTLNLGSSLASSWAHSAANELKIGLIQPIIRPGDFNHTLKQHVQGTQALAKKGARVVVAVEGMYPGYPSNDLMFNSDYIERSDQAAEAFIEATRDLDVISVFGRVSKNPNPRGRELQNFLEVVHQGKSVQRRAKILLPTYGPFDDARYFEPGKISEIQLLEVDGFKIAFGICEELWFYDRQNGRLIYHHNPIAKIKALNPDLVISINASPGQYEKLRFRIENQDGPGGGVARRLGKPVIYVNQAGVVDQLIFDGASFGVDANGKLAFKLKSFAADSALITVPKSRNEPMRNDADRTQDLYIDSEDDQAIDATIFWLKEFIPQIRHTSVTFGLSGGIDSAMTALWAVEALGPENVFPILMPSDLSSEGSITDSLRLVKNLGIPEANVLIIPIKEIVAAYYSTLEKIGLPREFLDYIAKDGKNFANATMENIQARNRMVLEFFISNLTGNILPEMKPILDTLMKRDPRWADYLSKKKAKLATGDLSEILVGNGTLFGDIAGVGGPNLNKFKTDLWRLARRWNARVGREVIPNKIIDKEPSPELMKQQLTTDLYPPYQILDHLLKDLFIRKMTPAQLHAKYDGWDDRVAPQFRPWVDFVLRVFSNNEFKRELAQMPSARWYGNSVGKERRVTLVAQRYQAPMTAQQCVDYLRESALSSERR